MNTKIIILGCVFAIICLGFITLSYAESDSPKTIAKSNSPKTIISFVVPESGESIILPQDLHPKVKVVESMFEERHGTLMSKIIWTQEIKSGIYTLQVVPKGEAYKLILVKTIFE